MTIYTPYTYLIGWSWLDVWYYGVEYSNSKEKIANPSNLWTIYFTSSEHVEVQRWLYGEPDIIQVRHTFKTAEEAINWESKVIERTGAIGSDKWLNLNRGGKKFICHGHSEKTKQNLKKLIKEQYTTRIRISPFLTREDGTSVQQDRVKSKTHHLMKRADGTSITSDRTLKGTNPFQHQIKKECPHCHKLVTPAVYVRFHGDRCGSSLQKKECPYCHRCFTPQMLSRWHDDRCKLKPS